MRREKCVRLIRTYEKYHERILPVLDFFSLLLGLIATFPLRFCNDATAHTVKVRVKHFNAQFTTINTLKSYRFALWLRSVTTESEWMEKKEFLRDIELTIKQ